MTTTPTTPTANAPSHPIRHRAVAALLVLLTVAAALGLTASPASAATPGPVQIFAAAGYDTFGRIFWTPPANTADGPFTYKVERYDEGKVGPQKIWSQQTTRAIEDHTLQEGIEYHYRVRASNGEGTGNWSLSVAVQLNPNLDPLHKFPTPAAFVKRQYQDLLGRQPGFGELNTHVLNLKNGTEGPDDLIDQLVNDPDRIALRQPVIRLYQAFFQRTPDHNGLDYWLKRRAGGKKLDDVANNFASSSEFKTKYGSLSNHDFVVLVYANVLQREPDAAGLAYWTKKLDTKQANRGRVMTQFSESNEFRVKSQGTVTAIDVYDDMMGAAIATPDLNKWGPHLQAGGNAGEYATWIMLRVAYQGG